LWLNNTIGGQFIWFCFADWCLSFF